MVTGSSGVSGFCSVGFGCPFWDVLSRGFLRPFVGWVPLVSVLVGGFWPFVVGVVAIFVAAGLDTTGFGVDAVVAGGGGGVSAGVSSAGGGTLP